MSFSLNQSAYVPDTTEYRHGYNSISNVCFVNAPEDANFSRCAMLYGGDRYRFYCFKGSSHDTFYQFAWNGSAYEYGYENIIPELSITGLPFDADCSKFAILHDGEDYRLFVRKLGAAVLYQCAWDGSFYTFGYKSIEELPLTGFPADADLSRWDMLHDGSTYRLYCMSYTCPTTLYQGAFSAESSSYEFGHQSIPKITLTENPESTTYSDIAMLHDGSDYRLYIPSA
ncbi:hypothetical protein BWQ96_09094 [Gracilariopsis chorda]|uniref:Uncharacterized protein n=1 Tax=Gracilariopsis chorda TaxID=448386 RepID=A0A2V3IGL5_9FLOR|nr:hypothetical protein BWQ96_09094 [Gracilariopsis chorda]|eukprot:PXF41178.1 hypothetical protein BWQ96_09094 [Gracilariopsis chorda]